MNTQISRGSLLMKLLKRETTRAKYYEGLDITHNNELSTYQGIQR